MKKNNQIVKTLTEQVRWQLFWLGIGLFISCVFLVLYFALRAMDLTTDSLMTLEAESLLRQTSEHSGFELPQGETFSAFWQWDEIPASLRQHFDDTIPDSGEIIETIVVNDDGKDEYLYLLRHLDPRRGQLFLLSRHDSTEIETVFFALIKTALNQAFWLTLIIFIALFFLVRWLIRRTTQPLSLLSHWASDLGTNPEKPLDIDFPIQELNQLASQLRQGVDQIQAFNERERQFLKHASHELRTPLAIVQASLDTLALQSPESSQPTVQRALRASANMRDLSASLLWLARESDRPVDKTEVDVYSLCEQIIDDHRYLIKNREIKVQTRIQIKTLEIESDLLAIVIANLVRNAFQHSSDGIIIVDISSQGFTITNPINTQLKPESDTKSEHPGYGLGLQLVQRICKRMKWTFEADYFSGSVKIILKTSVEHEKDT